MTDETPPLPTIAVELADGIVAELRPIVADDAPLLEEGFDRLSESSRFARFGMGMDHLSHQEVSYLTDVDQRTHVAWGATIDGEAAGVARYLVLPDGQSAEIAVTVVDHFQRHGLGRHLFQALAAIARRDGLKTFRFEVDPSNYPVRRLMRDLAGGYPGPGESTGDVSVADLPETERDGAWVDLMTRFR